MLYIEYHNLRIKYSEAQRAYDEILTEKQQLFERTQPQGVNVEKERVTGGRDNNPFDDYIIAKDSKRIEERLAEIKSIMDGRKELLTLKGQELRASKDWLNIIYVYRYIDNLTITQIENRIPYSRAQIWRKLNKIKANIR